MLTSDPALQEEIEPVYRQYASLACGFDPEMGLGGLLLYAGDLTDERIALVRAANIAGAASLSASQDPQVQRRAIRDGVVDFLVTSLDEALRILKNEIRKRQTVSVAISADPDRVTAEMLERGVLPDLLPAPAEAERRATTAFLENGARLIESCSLPSDHRFLAFRQVPAEFEATIMGLLPEDDPATRRWLRLSPRYLGPAARRARSLPCTPDLERRLSAASLL